MGDWLRSLTVLAIACVTVIVGTLGLASVLVPGPASSDGQPASSSGASAVAVPEPTVGIPGIGGILAVTGDREGTFRLSREALDGPYSIVGDDGRIVIEADPVEITQISYAGLEFFPDPDECSIAPTHLDASRGLAFATLTCAEIADIRDSGVITISGELGLPADMLVGRDLPLTGGSISVGAETWTFESAFLSHFTQRGMSSGMGWADEERGVIHFAYDVQTHVTTVEAVETAAGLAPVPAGACSLAREELGRPNPRTLTVEYRIDCPSVEVPGLGAVPIQGIVIVDEVEYTG
jgi:hypothetical protein